jgi:hypothetical protein
MRRRKVREQRTANRLCPAPPPHSAVGLALVQAVVEDAELRTAKAEQRLALALHEKCDLKLRVTQLHAEARTPAGAEPPAAPRMAARPRVSGICSALSAASCVERRGTLCRAGRVAAVAVEHVQLAGQADGRCSAVGSAQRAACGARSRRGTPNERGRWVCCTLHGACCRACVASCVAAMHGACFAFRLADGRGGPPAPAD